MGRGPLLFSVTKNDLVIETFRSGGKGGQNQNKVESGVRIRHPDSGAVAESREHASQLANKKAAFERLARTPEFLKWHKLETSRRLGMVLDIEAEVNRQMAPQNLRVDVQRDGRWGPEELEACP